MTNDTKILINADGSCSGITSFTSGHTLFDPSEKDRMIKAEARNNPKAVINRLIRTGEYSDLVVRLIIENDLEDKYQYYLGSI